MKTTLRLHINKYILMIQECPGIMDSDLRGYSHHRWNFQNNSSQTSRRILNMQTCVL